VRKCGIIGVYRREGDVAAEIYEGLLMLQHRGQDSAGIVSTDWNKFHEHKANGLVKDVFDKETMSTLTVTNPLAPGPWPLAHTLPPVTVPSLPRSSFCVRGHERSAFTLVRSRRDPLASGTSAIRQQGPPLLPRPSPSSSTPPWASISSTTAT